MRSLPVPGADRRRRKRTPPTLESLLAATGERIATAEDQRTRNQIAVDKIRAAVNGGFLTLTRKGDNT